MDVRAAAPYPKSREYGTLGTRGKAKRPMSIDVMAGGRRLTHRGSYSMGDDRIGLVLVPGRSESSVLFELQGISLPGQDWL
jgi:hypothetical protein